MKLYGREAAKAILRECLDIQGKSKYEEIVDIKDDGVWTTEPYRNIFGKEAPSERDRFLWTYACELDGSDPLELPNLPIPFSANELAAFILDGIGLSIQLVFGEAEEVDSPSVDALNALPGSAREPKQALCDAYKALRDAEKTVGKLDAGLEAEAAKLTEEYKRKNSEANKREGVFAGNTSKAELHERRERAKASVKGFRELSIKARERRDSAFLVWRRAMVNELLKADHSCNGKVKTVQTTEPQWRREGSSSTLRDASTQQVMNHELAERGVIGGTTKPAERQVHKTQNRGRAILSYEVAQAKESSRDAASPQSVRDVMAEQPTQNTWDEYNLRRLWDQHKEAGMTHQKLAAKYGVTRQRISALLARAEGMFGQKKASPFSPLTVIKRRN